MTHHTLLTRLCGGFVLSGCVAASHPTAAQVVARAQTHAEPPAWEIEFHGGGMTGSDPSGGSARVPDPGVPFLTVAGPSRRVSSWYFGDGARLLNEALPSFGLVTSLDPVLHAPVSTRRSGASLGVSVRRRLTPRLRAEVSVDYSLGQLAFDRDVLQTIEASRVGFVAAFRTLPFAGTSTSSTASIRDVAGREIVTTASLAIDLKQRSGVMPFVIVGGGVISRTGDTLSIALRGTYSPQIPSGRAIEESDTVTVRYALADHDVAGVIGGGLRYGLSPRWVVRLEARAHVTKNSLRISLDANPLTVPAAPGTGSLIAVGTTPALQFSNASQAPSSLSGPPLQDFVTFTGSGIQSRVSITAGLGWRF